MYWVRFLGISETISGHVRVFFPSKVNEHGGTFDANSVADAVDVLGKVPRRNLKRLAHRLVHCFIRFGSGPPAETGGMPLGKVYAGFALTCAPHTRRAVGAIPPWSFSF